MILGVKEMLRHLETRSLASHVKERVLAPDSEEEGDILVCDFISLS